MGRSTETLCFPFLLGLRQRAEDFDGWTDQVLHDISVPILERVYVTLLGCDLLVDKVSALLCELLEDLVLDEELVLLVFESGVGHFGEELLID